MIVLSNVNSVDFDKFDEVWYVTRYNRGMRVGCTHVPELSPSAVLLSRYKSGQIGYEEFSSLFRREIEYNPILNKLVIISRLRCIQLVCYCPDYRTCHRKILYELLCELGANVFIE